MTNEEAIKTIKLAIAEVEWNYPMDYAVAFETAISALKKQIPKKLTIDRCSKILKCNIYACPNCGDTQNSNEYYNEYCWNCGQKIDWSDEE